MPRPPTREPLHQRPSSRARSSAPPTPHAPTWLPSKQFHLPVLSSWVPKIIPMQFRQHRHYCRSAPKTRPPPPPRLIVPGWPQAASAPGLRRQRVPRDSTAPTYPRHRTGARSAVEKPWWLPRRGRRLQVGGSHPGVSVARRLARSRLAGGCRTSAPPSYPAPARQVKYVISGDDCAPRRAPAPPGA